MTRMHSIYVGHDRLRTLAPRLYRLWQHMPGTFWLDSAYNTERLGRYSFLGTNPSLWLETIRDTTTVTANGQRHIFHDDPFRVLSRVAAPFLAQPAAGEAIPFAGGLVGCISYDLGQQRAGIAHPSYYKSAAAAQEPLQSFG